MSLLAIAHRAGNDLDALRTAVELGADLLEADVHVRSGALEVRHSKHLRPLPVLWDSGTDGRLELTSTTTPQLSLDRLLDGLAEAAVHDRPAPGLMLDLKGPGRVGPRVGALLAGRPPVPGLLVCGRWWPGVEATAAVPGVRTVLTARTRPELARLLRRVRRARPPYGVSLHGSLLVPAAVAELRRRVEVVMSWGVNDRDTLARVVDVGVNGIISDSPEVLAEVLARR